MEEVKGILYKGLYQWIKDNSECLQTHLLDNAVLCGEWLGMGQIKYPIDEFDKRFYMFAKANIDEEFNLYNIRYNHELFSYPFDDCSIPSFVGIVPEVTKIDVLPDKILLDGLYNNYTKKVQRKVEGFVINYKDNISKYVRLKNGKLQEHFDRGE